MKFHNLISYSSDARPGYCNVVLGSACSEPNPGTYLASADVGRIGNGAAWPYASIYADSGDCNNTVAASTLQDLTYRMAPPATSFAVSDVRVDLLANGYASCHLGDGDFFPHTEPNPNYEHSSVKLDVYFAQLVDGEVHQWPLLSDTLFIGKGDYVRSIRSLLSGQTYPSNIVVRKPDASGGDILCHLQVICSAEPRVRIELSAPDHGIFVAGVALIGDYVWNCLRVRLMAMPSCQT